jgi:hypothetical protein
MAAVDGEAPELDYTSMLSTRYSKLKGFCCDPDYAFPDSPPYLL